MKLLFFALLSFATLASASGYKKSLSFGLEAKYDMKELVDRSRNGEELIESIPYLKSASANYERFVNYRKHVTQSGRIIKTKEGYTNILVWSFNLESESGVSCRIELTPLIESFDRPGPHNFFVRAYARVEENNFFKIRLEQRRSDFIDLYLSNASNEVTCRKSADGLLTIDEVNEVLSSIFIIHEDVSLSVGLNEKISKTYDDSKRHLKGSYEAVREYAEDYDLVDDTKRYLRESLEAGMSLFD